MAMDMTATTIATNTSHALLLDILKPIREILKREDVTDICINGPGRLFVESQNGWETVEADKLNSTWLYSFARAVASYMSGAISERSPILSGHLPTGERVQIVIPPASELPSVTLRRPSDVTFTLSELEDKGTFLPLASSVIRASSRRAELRRELEALSSSGSFRGGRGGITNFLSEIVKKRLNVIISGATGSGKTTLSKALIAEIPLDERLISIEDARELEFPHPNTARLFFSRDGGGISPVTVKELLISCLRMKPDRIMLAELRDEEAYYYLRNVNSGHPGSITTIHANSAAGAVEQLMLMVRQSGAGAGLSREDITSLVRGLVDVILQMEGKRVTEIYFLPDVESIC